MKIDEFDWIFHLHEHRNWIIVVAGQERVVRFQTRYFC